MKGVDTSFRNNWGMYLFGFPIAFILACIWPVLFLVYFAIWVFGGDCPCSKCGHK